MRSTLKRLVFGMLETAGVNRLRRRHHRNDLVVLNYHGVLDKNHAKDDHHIYCNTVSRDEFEQHLQYITKHFNAVRASDVEKWAHREDELPPNPVLLTFDDGFRNNLTHAAPLLKRYGVPAIVFVCSGYLGTSRILWTQELYEIALCWPSPAIPDMATDSDFQLEPDRPQRAAMLVGRAKAEPMRRVEQWLSLLRDQAPLPAHLAQSDLYAFLTWEQARELLDYGLEIGSHTVDHWITTRCDGEELRTELIESKQQIESRLGIECGSFAYPNGGDADWSPQTAAAVKAADYRVAYALPDRIQPGRQVDAYSISRVAVPGHAAQSTFRARISGSIEALRTRS